MHSPETNPAETAETAVYRPEVVAHSNAAVTGLPILSATPLPGVRDVIEAQTADGRRMWVYAAPLPEEAPADPLPAAPTGVPRWARTAALLSLALSGSAVLAAVAVSIIAEAAEDLAHALTALAAAFYLIAQVALVLAVLCGAIVLTVKRGGGRAEATATSTATAKGLFKATATATATAVAKK